MPNRAEVIAEMELLGIGSDDRQKVEKVHKSNGLNGSNGTPLTTEATIHAHRIAIDEISEMADRMNTRIHEIRMSAQVADEALAKLEISLASLTTEEE